MRAAPWIASAALSLAVACGPPPGPPRYPGDLRATSDLGPDFTLRQEIAITFGDREARFEAVLEKRGDLLLLLALSPFGSRAFAIEQRGTSVELTRFVDEELPFPPRWVLLDVHRTLFLGLGAGPRPDGWTEEERAGERVRERWSGGRLLERTFDRLDGEPEGRIRIEYGDGMAPGEPPPLIHFDNGWLGYRIVIRTMDTPAP